jgi:hypothetical protein
MEMNEDLKLLRFYFVLLAIFTIGRWGLSLGGADYEATHQVFSIVILTMLSSAYYGGFVRRFLGSGVKRAMVLGLWIGFSAQLIVFGSTAISYLAGMDTFFNHPRALNLPEMPSFGDAMVIRLQGILGNTIFNALAAALGYAIGGVIPQDVQ